MGESLTQRRRVEDEVLRDVNSCQRGKSPALSAFSYSRKVERAGLMVPSEEATANYVPAAAVIRRWQALFGITRRKAHVGG